MPPMSQAIMRPISAARSSALIMEQLPMVSWKSTHCACGLGNCGKCPLPPLESEVRAQSHLC
ncbi:hypothetical protein LINPERHAP2_LOCUS18049 [Linum perenne]